MRRTMILASIGMAALLSWWPRAIQAQEKAPLRVGIAGLVHGHVDGFFASALKRKDIQIVGIAEVDHGLFEMYATKYALDEKLYHADLSEMVSRRSRRRCSATPRHLTICAPWRRAPSRAWP